MRLLGKSLILVGKKMNYAHIIVKNTYAIKFANKFIFHDRTKNINTKDHFIL